MITHGLIKILELSSNEINLFYEKIDEYFKQQILKNMSQLPLDSEDSKEILQSLVSLQYDILPQIGFSNEEIESHFSSHLKSLWEGNSKDLLKNGLDVMEI
jgi:hypothetical protein